MELVNYILKESQRINSKKAKKIAILSLYQVLQQPYFQNQYNFIEIVNRKGYKLYHPNLSYVPKAMNNKKDNGLFQYYTFKKNKTTEWIYDDALDFEDSKTIRYVHPDKYSILQEYKKIIKNSQNIQDMIEPLLRLAITNPHTLSILSNLSINEEYNNNKNIYNFIEQFLFSKDIEAEHEALFKILKKQQQFKSSIFKQEAHTSINSKNTIFMDQNLFKRKTEDSVRKILFETFKNNEPLEKVLSETNSNINIDDTNFLEKLKSNETEEKNRSINTDDIINFLFYKESNLYNSNNDIIYDDIKHFSLKQLLNKAEEIAAPLKTPFYYFKKSKNTTDFWFNRYNDISLDSKRTEEIAWINKNIKNKTIKELIDTAPEKYQIQTIVEKTLNQFKLNTESNISTNLEYFNVLEGNQSKSRYDNEDKARKIINRHSFSNLLIDQQEYKQSFLTDLHTEDPSTIANFPGFIMSSYTENEVLSYIYFIDEKKKKGTSFIECRGFEGYIFQYLSTRQNHRKQHKGYDLFCKAIEQSIKDNKSIMMTMTTENSYESINKIILKAQKKYKNKIAIFNTESTRKGDLYSLESITNNPELYNLPYNHSISDILAYYLFYKHQDQFNKNFITLTSDNIYRNNSDITVEQEAILYEETKENFINFLKEHKTVQSLSKKYPTLDSFQNVILTPGLEKSLTSYGICDNFMEQQELYLKTYYQKIIALKQKNTIEINIQKNKSTQKKRTLL